jgi:RHH-type proline utilization regulon transcriptional repressor/proline dehydrogenase/delta 1-pyrroline-5-carboxylate dehydrogenase
MTFLHPQLPAAPDGTDDDATERRTGEIGRELLERAHKHSASLASIWSDKLMGWTLKDAAFKTQLFRFVDAFPALRGAEQIFDHLRDYLTQPGVTLPPGFGIGLKAGGWLPAVAAKAITSQVESVASRFIVPADADHALPQLRKLWDRGLGFSVDLLGEACLSDVEAAAYQQRYTDLIDRLPRQAAQWASQPILERDHLGAIPRTNVSIKLTSLAARTDPIDFDSTIDRLVEVLKPILQSAARNSVFVNFDMEDHHFKELTVATFKRCCESVDFPAGLALQAYLRSGAEDARKIVEWSQRLGRRITIRLVKGAYWDFETIYAQTMGWPTPVWSRKADTDASFERMTATLLTATPRHDGQGGVCLALGSHNARSIAHGLALREQLDLPPDAMELQMLYGMADPLKEAAVEMGYRVREYVPVGEMIPGMAYLVRRLLENTSNESWLLASTSATASPQSLLESPHQSTVVDSPFFDRHAESQRHKLSPAVEGVGDAKPFLNEPTRDFSDAAQRNQFAAAARSAQVPRVPIDATIEQADHAIQAAHQAFAGWRDRDPLERANLLVKAAAVMRRQRDELSAVIIREAAKTWREADADVCEAIDFCEFYARCAPPLFQPQRLGRFVAELDEQWHIPRGPAAIISPWNFPLSICAGMTVAALVTGNPAIVKPAEQTPAIAKLLCEILWQAGVPRDVLHYLPGVGETVGRALVRDPRVALIAFTGSRDVGLEILRAAADTSPAQHALKQVICEMGGKNAIIVDTSADLDEAVAAVRDSAFGYAGQKCSACSRVIVLESASDAFVSRLIEATRTLVMGDPLDPATQMGPVIDQAAAEKIRRYIEIGKQEGTLALGVMDVPPPVHGKPFIGPHIFTEIEPRHRLANEEIFGPVLSVMRARTFDEALHIANATDYKLTGGVFSRKPSHLERARREFRVGNLYLNRNITGARVARQPFGGFGMSGTGTKAGGRNYLLHFTLPRACCENTLRRGFAPQENF